MLLTGMSHEIRTQMNAIVAFSFLMKENYNKGTEYEDFSNHIYNSCEQLLRLFDSFLDSAIIETGSFNTESDVCKLDNIFDELLFDFREAIHREGKNELELITDVQFSNSSEILIDKVRVIRVIRTLFYTSLRNTNSGYIKIGYSSRNDKVTFYILDSGYGYTKFNEFLYTTDLNESLIKNNDTYTAINLILIKNLVQLMGGNLWIENNGLYGVGTYFSVPAKLIPKTDIIIDKYVSKIAI